MARPGRSPGGERSVVSLEVLGLEILVLDHTTP
jgi:hypothetical protein